MSDAGRSHGNSDKVDDLLAHHGAGGGYEAVLANAALGRLEGLFPPEELRQLGQSLLRHPAAVARRAVDLAARLAHIAIGTDTQPGTLERRFADRAWADNPALRRLALSYLASSQALAGLLDDAELDRRARDRLQVTVENVLAAAAPTNNPLTNPAAWKEAIDTGGRSVVDGLRQLTADLQSPARLPAGVDKTAFRVGDNIAATPGKVVRKTRLYELIQYQPTAGQVDVTPSLMIASPVNKFYLLDLEPEQSVVRAQVAAGRNLFVASWVNPDQSHADVGVDEYVGAVVEMLETVAQISGTPSSHLLGLCGGGLIVFLAAAYLAAAGRQDLLASLTVGIAVLDYDRGPQMMAFLDRKAVDTAMRKATQRGYFDARDSLWAFALIRPDEGIWSIAVHNYLLGRPLPRIGLLYWAIDQTNLATKYGGQVMELALDNSLTRTGAATILGAPVDTRQITVDTYILAASADHISPWHDCYRTINMVGGATTFVLAKGGHAIVIARPPGAPPCQLPDQRHPRRRSGAVARRLRRQQGQLVGALERLDRETRPRQATAPRHLGSDAHPVIGDAPGEYVRRRLT